MHIWYPCPLKKAFPGAPPVAMWNSAELDGLLDGALLFART